MSIHDYSHILISIPDMNTRLRSCVLKFAVGDTYFYIHGKKLINPFSYTLSEHV